MRKKIAVVTGTRAEFGILEPLLQNINDSEKLDLELIVTGMHLLKQYGFSINEIKKSDFEIAATVEMYVGDEKNSEYYAKSLSQGIDNFSNLLLKINPDIVVVFGDRLEILATSLAAALLEIPLAHIHGGDKTDSGHIDESIRHSISRFAHIHFTATSEHTDRLKKMGEENWRIHEVGALGLDSIINHKRLSKKEIAQKMELKEDSEILICLFHPVHLDKDIAGDQMHEVLEAVKEIEKQTVLIYPNNDSGSQYIIKEIKQYEKLPFLKTFETLSHSDYINLLSNADVLIGNSSSGIIEAPSYKLPVVNIGSRNVGRQHAENMIYVDAEKEKIISGVNKALYDEDFKKELRVCNNPYGDGKTSNRIVEILSKIKIDKNLLQKKITY